MSSSSSELLLMALLSTQDESGPDFNYFRCKRFEVTIDLKHARHIKYAKRTVFFLKLLLRVSK